MLTICAGFLELPIPCLSLCLKLYLSLFEALFKTRRCNSMLNHKANILSVSMLAICAGFPQLPIPCLSLQQLPIPYLSLVPCLKLCLSRFEALLKTRGCNSMLNRKANILQTLFAFGCTICTRCLVLYEDYTKSFTYV